MTLPIAAMAPVALELLNALLTADENARRHEISKMEMQLRSMELDIQHETIEFHRETLRTRRDAFESFLSTLKSSFDRKVALFETTQNFVFAEYSRDKRELQAERVHLRELIANSPTIQAAGQARRDLVRLEERAREIEIIHAENVHRFQATALALSPADFSQVRLSGQIE